MTTNRDATQNELRRGMSIPTGKQSRFRLSPNEVRVRLKIHGKVARLEHCEVLFGGELVASLRTDGDGVLVVPLPRGVHRLEVWLPQRKFGRSLDIYAPGSFPPEQTLVGIQHRLNNLGYFCGKTDGLMGPLTRAALTQFARDFGTGRRSAHDDKTAQEIIRATDREAPLWPQK